MSTHHLLAMPIDEHAALLMWAEYSAIHTETVTLCPDYTVEHFGDSAELADLLLHEVIHGSKRATSSWPPNLRLAAKRSRVLAHTGLPVTVQGILG